MKTPQARGHELNERDADSSTTAWSSAPAPAGSSIDLRAVHRLLAGGGRQVCEHDLRVQKAAVKVSFYMIMASVQQKPEGNVHLERIAARHSRKALDIGPHLYDQWLECLIQAVRECDPVFDNETEQVWRRVMRVGIES